MEAGDLNRAVQYYKVSWSSVLFVHMHINLGREVHVHSYLCLGIYVVFPR